MTGAESSIQNAVLNKNMMMDNYQEVDNSTIKFTELFTLTSQSDSDCVNNWCSAIS
jgi:hypothetical protein